MQGKLLTALVALTLSAPIFAQDTTNSAQATDNATRSQTDNLSNSTRNNQQSSNDENTPTKSGDNSTSMHGGMANGDFDTMDKTHRGYLMPSDVKSNKKLSSNFKNCDKNHDGRLSRDEYEACSTGT